MNKQSALDSMPAFLRGNPTVPQCKAFFGSLKRQAELEPSKQDEIGKAIVNSIKPA